MIINESLGIDSQGDIGSSGYAHVLLAWVELGYQVVGVWGISSQSRKKTLMVC